MQPSPYASKSFWAGVRDRAIKTFAQSLASSLTIGVGILGIDWKGALSVAVGAVLFSVATSLADPQETDKAIATMPPTPPTTHVAG